MARQADVSDSSGSGYAYVSSPSQSPYGLVAKVDPFGGLQTAGSLAPLMLDAFDATLDTTNRWATSGTVTPAVSGGQVVGSLGAVNSASSVMVSQPTFNPGGQSHMLAGQLSIGSAQTDPNAHRFFGSGVVTSYAAATPLTNGFGFEVDITGALNCVVYISGTRYVANSTNPALITAPGGWAANMVLVQYAAMTWPATGNAIILMRYFAGYCFFYMSQGVTGVDVPIALATWVPAVTALPIRFAAITTPAVSTVLATTWALSGFLLGAAGGTNYTNSSPANPWRMQEVDAQNRAYSVAPDVYVTGVAAQSAATNNILLTAAGTTSIDTWAVGSRSIAVQIVPTGTVSSGVVTFEGSQDSVTFVPLPLYDTASLTANPISTVSPATGVSRYFAGNTLYRYIKARISTVIGGGGSIQAHYTLNQSMYQPNIQTVTQATGANLNAAISAGTITAVTTLANGQTAHSAASTGSPLRVGGRVGPAAVETTLVAGDATDWIADLNGAGTVKPYAHSTVDWTYAAASGGIVNTSDVAMAAARGASIRNYVTAIQIQNAHATVATEVVVKDGSTVIWRGYLSAGANAPPLCPALPTPLRGTAATAMNVACITTGAAVYVNAQGYQAA